MTYVQVIEKFPRSVQHLITGLVVTSILLRYLFPDANYNPRYAWRFVKIVYCAIRNELERQNASVETNDLIERIFELGAPTFSRKEIKEKFVSYSEGDDDPVCKYFSLTQYLQATTGLPMGKKYVKYISVPLMYMYAIYPKMCVVCRDGIFDYWRQKKQEKYCKQVLELQTITGMFILTPALAQAIRRVKYGEADPDIEHYSYFMKMFAEDIYTAAGATMADMNSLLSAPLHRDRMVPFRIKFDIGRYND